MSKVTHTPGPWTPITAGTRTLTGVDTGGLYRYHAYWDGIAENAEMEANARLIAAAPDLLEALKDTRTNCGDLLPDYYAVLIDAAIAKAEGEDT